MLVYYYCYFFFNNIEHFGRRRISWYLYESKFIIFKTFTKNFSGCFIYLLFYKYYWKSSRKFIRYDNCLIVIKLLLFYHKYVMICGLCSSGKILNSSNSANYDTIWVLCLFNSYVSYDLEQIQFVPRLVRNKLLF